MARLDDSRQRLEMSVRRLEAAVEKKVVGSPRDVERLQQALDSAQMDYARLESTTETLASRLDGTIGRLRRLLGQ